MPLGIGLHTWGVTACDGMSIGIEGGVTAVAVMTATEASQMGPLSLANMEAKVGSDEMVAHTE